MAFIESQVIRDVYVALKHILNTLNRPLWVDPSTSRVRAVVEAGTLPTVTTVTGVTTVTTVTTTGTLTNLGAGNVIGLNIDRLSWAQNVRARIT